MDIVIMTRGRVFKQRTLRSLSSVHHNVKFYAPPSECSELERLYSVEAVPFVHDNPNYSTKFQRIVEDHDDKVCILDDDLVFSRREGNSLLMLKDEALIEHMPRLFDLIEAHLDEVAQCGVHPRQMGHLAPIPYKVNGKVITVNGLNCAMLKESGFGKTWRVDDFPLLADTFMNAHVLTKFGENRLVTQYCVDWGASQAAGGCSYRTMEMQENCVGGLVSAFPDFFTKVIKTPKVSKWLGDNRVDYRAQWAKMARVGGGKHPK